MTPSLLTALLFVAIPVLLCILTLLYITRERKPKRLKYSQMRREEAWMGRYHAPSPPRTTIHTLVNKVFAKPTVWTLPHSVMGQEDYSDISFYQGDIDWQRMRTKASKVIIRAGQNLWTDIKFVWNWIEARKKGFARSTYWFYDGRISPGTQAAKWVSLVKDDRPELDMVLDWERSYNGAYEGLRNVVAMMQEVERLLPGYEVTLYTNYYFFTENSNPIYNAAQYAYLAKRKLYIAFYGAVEKILIPKPWTKPYRWQWGTPVWGLEWGVESKEIDMNKDMESDGDPTPLPDPEPIGETMQYKFIVGTNERTDPVVTNNLTGRFYAVGEVVEVVSISGVIGSDRWMKLDNGNYAALVYNGTTRAELVTPLPPADEIRLRLSIPITATINGRDYVKTIEIDTVLDAVE